MNDASNVFSSQVFINCRIMVGNRLLLMAHRKKRLKTSMSGTMYLFFSWYYFYLLGHVLDIRQSAQVAEAVKVTGVLS